MKPLLAFDTETTGIPDWKSPSEAEHQPHLLQLGAILADPETREEVSALNVIVRPDGWDIPCEIVELTGITLEQAMDEGIPEAEALEQFLDFYRQADLRVAHNTTFDNRILRIALKRYRPELISDEEWKDRDRYYCTLMNARKIMGGKDGHTLVECYPHFCGKPLENAHNAIDDARAALHIYWAQLDR